MGLAKGFLNLSWAIDFTTPDFDLKEKFLVSLQKGMGPAKGFLITSLGIDCTIATTVSKKMAGKWCFGNCK